MAVEVREIYESRSGTQRGAIGTCTRVYLLIGQDNPAKAITTPGVPPLGEVFEWNQMALTVKAYGVPSVVAPGTCRVEVFYDNDGSSTGPQGPDTQDPLYHNINISWVRDVERVPAFKLFHDIVDIDPFRDEPGNAEGPYARAERWEPVEWSWDFRYASAEVTVNLDNMDAQVQREIARQVNVIHKFPDGLLWQLVGGNTRRTGERQWSITYSWIHDPGQRVGAPDAILIPGITDTGVFVDRLVGDGSLDAGAIMLPYFPRPPFARYSEVPNQRPYTMNGDPNLYRPDIKLIPLDAYRVLDESGWQTLPGNPIR